MRPHYVIDASALVPVFYPEKPGDRAARNSVFTLLEECAKGRAFLHIPDFCMAECSKALARMAFGRHRDYSDARDEYRQKIDGLLDIVSSSRRGVARRMSLKRRHLVDIEDIFLMEYALAPRERNRLSGLDALIIAMAKLHGAHFGTDRVFIVTADAWLATVCNANRPDLPRAIDTLRDPIPPPEI